jgi:hypothetical protein
LRLSQAITFGANCRLDVAALRAGEERHGADYTITMFSLQLMPWRATSGGDRLRGLFRLPGWRVADKDAAGSRNRTARFSKRPARSPDQYQVVPYPASLAKELEARQVRISESVEGLQQKFRAGP